MADGNKVQYWVEVALQDNKLKEQLKGWNWKDIMGLDDLSDVFSKEGNEAVAAFNKAIASTDIDWAKVLGSKELKKGINAIIRGTNDAMRSNLGKLGDKELKVVSDFVAAVGAAAKESGANLSVATNSIMAFARVIAPLEGQLDKLAEGFKVVAERMNQLNGSKPAVITPSFDFAKVDKDVESLKRRLGNLSANVEVDIKGNAGKEISNIATDLDAVQQEIEETKMALENTVESDAEGIKKLQTQLANAYIKAAEYYRKLDALKSKYRDDMEIEGIDVDGLSKSFKIAKKSAEKYIGALSKTSSGDIDSAVNIPIAVPTADDIRAAINAEIVKLNKRKDALQSVKIKVDPTGANIGDATEVEDDNFIQTINKRFDSISNAIKTRQDEIVTQTRDVWRKEILQQLKFRSSDFEFNFGDALMEGLQTALDEADFKVNIDTEFLANQIKSIFENTNVSLGAGTANIDKESMTAAVMAGVRAALFGEQMVATTPSPVSAEVVEGAEHIAKETENVAQRLDIAEDYVKDVVEKIKAIAKYAVKPADKDSPGAKATRDRFRLLGIDLEDINKTTDDAKIAKKLEDVLLKKDDNGRLTGSTIIDELSSFKGSTSKTIPAFLKSLHEVFFMLQESTQSVEEWTRISKSRELLDEARAKARDAVALLDVRKTIKKGETPTLAEIDELTATMEPYLEQVAKRSLSYSGKKIEELAQAKRDKNPTLDFGQSLEEARKEIYDQILASLKASFADFRAAREVLGDKTDDASMTEFQSAAESFYKSSTVLFNNLKKQAEDMFKGEIYLQNGKNGRLKRRDINTYKQLANIKDDDVIVDVRVTSSLNNVAIGETKSEYDERRLMRGQQADYLVDKRHEEDILNRRLTYGEFKVQGAPVADINVDQTLEANQKRKEALMAEIQLKENEKHSLEQEILALDEKISQLTERNSKIPESRRTAAIEKVSRYETQEEQLTSEILFGDQRIQQITANIKEQKEKQIRAEQQLTRLTELDVERTKKSIQNKIRNAETEQSTLQSQLQEQQKIYGALETNRAFEQAEVFKARSALKAIPNTKANESARAEAEKRVVEAEQRLDGAVKTLDNVGKEINETNEAIKKKTTLIETLNRQVSETTLDTIRKEQQDRINNISAIISNLELELANAFSQQSVRKNNLRVAKLKLRNAKNTIAFKAQDELDEAIETKTLMETRLVQTAQSLQQNSAEISQLDSANIGLVEWQKRNDLQKRALVLQGEIKKLEQAGASEDAIASKRVELEEINKTLEVSINEVAELKEQLVTLRAREIELQNMRRGGLPSALFRQTEEESKRIGAQIGNIEERLRSVGGFIGQQETKTFSDVERKTYALGQLKFIDDDLITARAQKSVINARMSKKDREIEEVDKYGLGAGIGARELSREKSRLTTEFMRSEYVQSLFDELGSKRDADLQKARNQVEAAKQNSRANFDDKVSKAMIRDGLNPFSKEQTDQFLQTQRGAEYSKAYASEIDALQEGLRERERSIWETYDHDLKEKRKQVLEDFKTSVRTDKGVLSYSSKIKNDAGEWIDSIIEIDVKTNLKERLEEERRILKEQLEGDAKSGKPSIQSEIDRLEEARRQAINYGSVGESEILSADIIKDQIQKEEKLAKLQDERATKLQELNDLEKAGLPEDDQSIKQAQKALANLDKEIARYEMLVRNRQKLVELRWDESKSSSYTAEEKELHFTEQIVNCNQKIEDSLARQEGLKEKLNVATDEEKTKLQYQLDQEESKVEKWRKDITTFEGKIQKISNERTGAAEVSATVDKTDGALGDLIKQVVGGDNIDNATLSAIAEMVEKILNVLTGGQPSKNSEMDKKLARIAELEAKSKAAKSERSRRNKELTAYHGTKNGGFTAFDMSKYRSGQAIYLTNSKAVAATYAAGSDKDIDLKSGQMGQKGVYTVNVKADKVLTVDANGAIWSKLGEKGNIDGKPLIRSTNKLGYKLNAVQNPETSEIYYDKSSFIGVDDDSLPPLALEGTAEQITKQMLDAGYTQEIVDLILYRSKQDIELNLEKLKNGQTVTTKPRYGTIGFNKELQKLAQETTDDIVEQAFAQGYDRVDFKNIRDIGPGMGKNAGKLKSLSTMHAIRSASQVQIVDPKIQKASPTKLSKKERAELSTLRKEVKGYDANNDASLGFDALAKQETLSKILDVLNAFKSEGVKTTGKKQADAEDKAPKKTEAELIKERALKDKDAVLGIASNSKVKKKYEQLVKQLEAETDLGKIKALAQKTSALGFNIKKESAEWDYKTADANRVYNIPNANLFGKRKETVRKSMEKLAQTQFNPEGKQYEFLNFDGKQLVYQLTDVRGNVEKVTMEWSELNNQVAITSDKSVSKLDELASKIEAFGGKFENAIDAGYLGEKDKDLKKFQDAVAKINDEISNGASFETVDKLRNEALRLADIVDKKVAKTKRSYSGTTEINAVNRQRDNMGPSGILNQEGLARVKEYNASYDALMKKFNRFKNNGTLFNPKNQKTLQEMALHTKSLGKELEKAANNSQRLEEAIRNSGTFNGQKIGAEFKVADDVSVYDQMVAKLKELGAEHIKVDRVRQIATGTIRHNNTTVSDLTVEYDKLRGSLARYQKQERESLTGLPAFLNGFQKKFNSIMQYLTMTMSIHQVLAQLRQGVQYIKEIDLALTELRKVTDETEESYERFLETASKTAEKVGSTIQKVVSSTADWARLGSILAQTNIRPII